MSKVTFVTVIEAWVDVAQHICATEGWGPPADNGDAVRLLGGHRVLTTELAISIREAVGFRNVACRYRLHGAMLLGVAPAILSVPGATLRVMDTLSNVSDTSYEIPLSEADQTALRPALLHDLGAMPFESGALISRSLWVIFIGEWGVWTHAVLPVDDRLDMPDKESIAGLCALVGSLMSPPLCHDDEKAMIVLRRPGTVEISEADAYIFRLVRQAAIGRETAPWTFHVVGPDGIREVTEREASQNTSG